MEVDQQEVQALLLWELANDEKREGKFSDAIAFLDEIDDDNVGNQPTTEPSKGSAYNI